MIVCWSIALILLALVCGTGLGYGLGVKDFASCPACVCGDCSASFEQCPPQNVTIVYHNCASSELNLSEGV